MVETSFPITVRTRRFLPWADGLFAMAGMLVVDATCGVILIRLLIRAAAEPHWTIFVAAAAFAGFTVLVAWIGVGATRNTLRQICLIGAELDVNRDKISVARGAIWSIEGRQVLGVQRAFGGIKVLYKCDGEPRTLLLPRVLFRKDQFENLRAAVETFARKPGGESS